MENIQATHAAFAALTKSGDVVAWGDPFAGGDASAVQNQLKNVKQIQAWFAGSHVNEKASLEPWNFDVSEVDCTKMGSFFGPGVGISYVFIGVA